jgi:hypothetical protein
MGLRNIDFVQPQDRGFFGWLASRHEFNQSGRRNAARRERTKIESVSSGDVCKTF